MVILNFTKDEVSYDVPEEVGSLTQSVAQIGNYPGKSSMFSKRTLSLKPYEALVLVFEDKA